MKPVFAYISLFILLFGCKNEQTTISENIQSDGIVVAENIIYDVIVKPEVEDQWELEKVEGYKGTNMIDQLFEGIYSGDLKVRDYYTGEAMSAGDIRKIEKDPRYRRELIGKIQFTEEWRFVAQDLQIEKKVLSLVFGYRSGTEDNVSVGYLAAFQIDLN